MTQQTLTGLDALAHAGLGSIANTGGSRPCPMGPMTGETAGVSGRESGREGIAHCKQPQRPFRGLGEYSSPSGDRDCFQENGESVLSSEGPRWKENKG